MICAKKVEEKYIPPKMYAEDLSKFFEEAALCIQEGISGMMP